MVVLTLAPRTQRLHLWISRVISCLQKMLSQFLPRSNGLANRMNLREGVKDASLKTSLDAAELTWPNRLDVTQDKHRRQNSIRSIPRDIF